MISNLGHYQSMKNDIHSNDSNFHQKHTFIFKFPKFSIIADKLFGVKNKN